MCYAIKNIWLPALEFHSIIAVSLTCTCRFFGQLLYKQRCFSVNANYGIIKSFKTFKLLVLYKNEKAVLTCLMMKSKLKYFFNDTWIGVTLYFLFALFYFCFVGCCFIIGIIRLVKEVKIDFLLEKVLSSETSTFLIKAISVVIALFLTTATLMGTKLLIKKIRDLS